jgi:hypothetical protein
MTFRSSAMTFFVALPFGVDVVLADTAVKTGSEGRMLPRICGLPLTS